MPQDLDKPIQVVILSFQKQDMRAFVFGEYLKKSEQIENPICEQRNKLDFLIWGYIHYCCATKLIDLCS